MQKRSILLGTYNTADYGWTLASWKLSDPEQKTNYVEKSGGDGSWDLSTALTDDIPRYRDRTLTAVLELSEGDRLSRKAEIARMTNLLDGMTETIELPDDPDHYLIGRVHVSEDYNDPAHAAVTVTAVCEPWLYSKTTITRSFTAGTTEQTTTLANVGRRVAVPTITVTGSGASVLLKCGTASKAFSAGTYVWTELLIPPGGKELTYSGSGSFSLTYREAVLK